jgi:hypothetical protein
MPDIKQTLQTLKAKGRVQGPAQPRKVDRSGKPRRPDEHLKRSAQESELEPKAAPEAINPTAPMKAPKAERRASGAETDPKIEARDALERELASEAKEPPTTDAKSGGRASGSAAREMSDDDGELLKAIPTERVELEARQGASHSVANGQTKAAVPALALVSQTSKSETASSSNLTDGAKELTAITRLLRADTCYYLAFLEMRDPSSGIVDLPHLGYAELFAVRKNTIAPMIRRLIDAGALSVERAYDAGTRTTWAYRVAERHHLAERAPAPGAL